MTVVVDPTFGDKLLALPAGTPVWIVESQPNRHAAEQVRARRSTSSGADVAVFRGGAASPAQICAEILPTVHLHHGELSAKPPYSSLDIIGAEPTPDLMATLADLGFGYIERRRDGFIARAL